MMEDKKTTEEDKDLLLDKEKQEISKDYQQTIESTENNTKESFEIKSHYIVDDENKSINPVIEYRKLPEVKALIPLPPKPKYSYLKKWLVRSKF